MIGEEEDTRVPGDGEPFGDGEGTYRDSFEHERQLATEAMARAIAFPETHAATGVVVFAKRLHSRCLGKAACIRVHGEMAINSEDKCAGCGVSWYLADPRGTKRTVGRSDSVQ